MDLLWVEFFATGNLAPLLRIIGVLDEPDIVRAKLTQWLLETGTGAAKSAAVWSLKANSEAHAPVARLCEFEATKQGGAARLLLSRPPQ